MMLRSRTSLQEYYSSRQNYHQFTISDIPWEDVLYKKVLPYLSLRDLFNLRATCTTNKTLVEQFFRLLTQVVFPLNCKLNRRVFRILTIRCRNVEKAHLYKCSWLKKRDATLFFKRNPNINDISFNYCNAAVNRLLHIAVVNCKNLNKIYLAGCKDLTVGAVETLICHVKNLHTLDLSRCALLSEKCVLKVIEKFYNIKNLSLAGIPSVTDHIILIINDHCPDIENLNVNDCTVNIALLRTVNEHCRKIRTIRAYNTILTFEPLEQ